MIIIKDAGQIKWCLKESFSCMVIIAKYDKGKSSIITEAIHDFFGEANTVYLTFTEQAKPGFVPREVKVKFGEHIKGKVIVFDEVSDDKNRNIRAYLNELIKNNKVIILSNPYGSSNNPEKEISLFKEHEDVPEDAKFIFLKDA